MCTTPLQKTKRSEIKRTSQECACRDILPDLGNRPVKGNGLIQGDEVPAGYWYGVMQIGSSKLRNQTLAS